MTKCQTCSGFLDVYFGNSHLPTYLRIKLIERTLTLCNLAGKNTLSIKHVKSVFRVIAQAPGALVRRNTVIVIYTGKCATGMTYLLHVHFKNTEYHFKNTYVTPMSCMLTIMQVPHASRMIHKHFISNVPQAFHTFRFDR